MAKLPILATGVVNNGPLNGGIESSLGYRINADGTVATSTTKDPAAYLGLGGWLRNPDGSIVIGAKAAGARLTQNGVLTNLNGSAVATTAATNPFRNSGGLLVNSDLSMIVNNGNT